MKKNLFALSIITALFSCNSSDDTSTTTRVTENATGGNDTNSRSYNALVEAAPYIDTSITVDNAYSNLFIDSAALTKFTSAKAPPASPPFLSFASARIK